MIILIVLNTFFIYRLYSLESQASSCALFGYRLLASL